MNAEQSLPLPELLTQEPFTIQEGPPCVDLRKRVLFVPFGIDQHSVFVKAHELAHIEWSPWESSGRLVRRHRLNWDALQAVEDLRMHARLAAAGVDLSAGGQPHDETREFCRRLVEAREFPTAALCAVAIHGTGSFEVFRDCLTGTPLQGALELAVEARHRLDEHGCQQFGSTVTVARWLQEELRLPLGVGKPAPGR